MKRGTPRFCPRCGKRLAPKIIEDRKRPFCAACDRAYFENPLPSAAAFVQNDRGEILLVKRGVSPGKGEWALPSGFIEIDEAPEEACVRELKEETGLNGSICSLMGVYSQSSSMYKSVIIIAYAVKASGVPQPGSDSLSTKYFRPDRLPKIAFPSHREIIEDGIKEDDS